MPFLRHCIWLVLLSNAFLLSRRVWDVSSPAVPGLTSLLTVSLRSGSTAAALQQGGCHCADDGVCFNRCSASMESCQHACYAMPNGETCFKACEATFAQCVHQPGKCPGGGGGTLCANCPSCAGACQRAYAACDECCGGSDGDGRQGCLVDQQYCLAKNTNCF